MIEGRPYGVALIPASNAASSRASFGRRESAALQPKIRRLASNAVRPSSGHADPSIFKRCNVRRNAVQAEVAEWGTSRKSCVQFPRCLQIACVDIISKRRQHWLQQVTRGFLLPFLSPQRRQVHGGTQLP